MNTNSSKKTKLLSAKEKQWYYTPEGTFVFTEQYHLNRGYCCKNGCLHCPYGFKANRDTPANFTEKNP